MVEISDLEYEKQRSSEKWRLIENNKLPLSNTPVLIVSGKLIGKIGIAEYFWSCDDNVLLWRTASGIFLNHSEVIAWCPIPKYQTAGMELELESVKK